MPVTPRRILTCTCEGTMPIDTAAMEQAGLSVTGKPAHQLCRAELAHFKKALGEFAAVTVTCTQEAPLFTEIAEEAGFEGDLSFVNIRENAGWSDAADQSGPKMAALAAMGAVTPAPFDLVTMESAGVALILGAGPEALEVAETLAETLDMTVLLTPGARVAPPRQTVFPVLQGRVRRAQGHLGAFELVVDDYAAPAPSSRDELRFEVGRDGAVSRCDLVIDLTGAPPLFPAADLRPGYFRADPRDPVGLSRTTLQAAQMVGTFDKPRHIAFSPELCAHSRNRITGCTRCLDLCPTGAITPAGDSVAIDAEICAGCGQCAAACPTGAAAYALPPVETLAERLRTGLGAWFAAGGRSAPVIVLHDADHGAALVEASARHGRGLPAHAIPVQVNEPTQIGPEGLAAALAYGAGGVRIVTRARPTHPVDGLEETLALIDVICAETGYPAETCALIQTDDPDALEDALWRPAARARATRSTFLPPADKRGLLVLAMSEMNRTAPEPAQDIELPPGAPFGTVVLDAQACTLCMACVGACPAGALHDNPDLPMLRFTESACVQCGICAATCPEDAIGLTPRIDIAAWDTPRRLLKQEEPFCCTACGKPFGTRSAIARIQDRLQDHWMFAGQDGARRRALLTMCDDCRARQVVEDGFDPIDKEKTTGPR
ncbi:MAG: Dissimilatory sulfite reductase [Rhodobacteraceae bacterium HLUCCA12]|nr:MAG: Dissimilatory sulfite reductase [Rhodobacteraceae bacterium HLUCCA12]